ncbi:MAG: DUF456 domain-containing protein [Mizugakiibacter sp.]|uniref:DUF456 domain-containing protein n=1 Tax=Mizugakiibacter sp. TaxID=1972610 RepID=UPI0031C3CCBE|nr:DUF456 domain-containing protein [Xanthomonadaceae bacterium]
MTVALFALAALLILIGLAGVILPALPGVPLMFAGMLLAAWADGFHHVGALTLTVLGLLAVLALLVDFAAGALGAKRVGASGLALLGAALGTVAGLFFGIPGLLLGPFIGALAGELLAGGGVARAANVGAGTWIGLLLGTLVKLALSFAMLGVFALALLL